MARYTKNEHGSLLLLSARDTRDWASRPGKSWPCSTLAGHRVRAEFASNGDLLDVSVDGRSKDIPADEFNAITEDFMKTELEL